MRRPRTPVHWSRMKVRGARRKQKTAERITHRTELMVVPTSRADGRYTFRMARPGEPGAMLMVATQRTDGWGRAA